MTDIKEIASEQLRKCDWWGGAGQALPELYVEQLITEIDRLNQIVENYRHRIGALDARVNGLQTFEENHFVISNQCSILKAGMDLLKLSIIEARSLPESRQDEADGILREALKQTEICHA